MAEDMVERVGADPDRHGILTVIERRKGKTKGERWLLRCDCGTVRWLPRWHAKAIRSCGCRAGLSLARPAERHGMRNSPEYGVWMGMKRRCTYPTAADYASYGGRGIRVCDRWKSFIAFHEDMGLRPSPTHSIDRIDVNGDYAPGNCRWATRKEQQRNRRNNRLIATPSGTTTVTEAAERYGIDKNILFGRLNQGWPVERALGLES